MPTADLIAPTWHTAPAWDYTYGPEVAELVALTSDDKGPFILDPEQRLVLDDWFGYSRETDKLAAFEGGVIACRQNLKTGVLKAAALGKVFISEQRLVVWTAHEFFAAAEAFRDLRIMLESAPDLDAEVLKVWTGAGSQAIEFTGDRRLIFKARHTGSGRSLSGDTVILDEGFALQPEHMGALVPTLAARPDPQLLIGSSAGMASSGVLRSLRDRGRVGGYRVAYAEWKAEERECPEGCSHMPTAENCRLDDRDLWGQANTAIARGRITLDTVAGMRQSMEPAKFARECLGWWDEPDGTSDPPITVAAWGELRDESSEIVGDPHIVVDVSPLSTWSVILAAGENRYGKAHVEITSREGKLDYRPGVLWVVPRLRDMAARLPGMVVTIVKGSAAESLIPAIERPWQDAGGNDHPGIPVAVMPTAEYLPACPAMVDAVAAQDVAHLGQPELTAAMVSSVPAKQDKGLWSWARIAPSVDIAPCVAATAGVRLVQGESTYDPLNNIY